MIDYLDQQALGDGTPTHVEDTDILPNTPPAGTKLPQDFDD